MIPSVQEQVKKIANSQEFLKTDGHAVTCSLIITVSFMLMTSFVRGATPIDVPTFPWGIFRYFFWIWCCSICPRAMSKFYYNSQSRYLYEIPSSFRSCYKWVARNGSKDKINTKIVSTYKIRRRSLSSGPSL